MLTGNNVFDSDEMDDLFNKINKGDYFVSTSFSKEDISFLNCIL